MLMNLCCCRIMEIDVVVVVVVVGVLMLWRKRDEHAWVDRFLWSSLAKGR